MLHSSLAPDNTTHNIHRARSSLGHVDTNRSTKLWDTAYKDERRWKYRGGKRLSDGRYDGKTELSRLRSGEFSRRSLNGSFE